MGKDGSVIFKLSPHPAIGLQLVNQVNQACIFKLSHHPAFDQDLKILTWI